jgi:Kef-type K+ transport system membrane component KefB
MEEFQVNILAILVAAVAAFSLGTLLFAKQWMKAHGYTPDKLEAMKKDGAGLRCLFRLFFLIAAAIAILVVRLAVGSVFWGITLRRSSLSFVRHNHQSVRVRRNFCGQLPLQSSGRAV